MTHTYPFKESFSFTSCVLDLMFQLRMSVMMLIQGQEGLNSDGRPTLKQQSFTDIIYPVLDTETTSRYLE